MCWYSLLLCWNVSWPRRLLPLVIYGEYGDQIDRQTDRQTPVCYITLSARRGQCNKKKHLCVVGCPKQILDHSLCLYCEWLLFTEQLLSSRWRGEWQWKIGVCSSEASNGDSRLLFWYSASVARSMLTLAEHVILDLVYNGWHLADTRTVVALLWFTSNH